MKTRLLIIIGIIFSGGFVIVNVYADCNINSDWSDAPCIDQIINNKLPQYQVDQWTDYYDYKGNKFMESKKQEMNNAINSDQLLEWIDISIQNQNVWQYYYFSGQAPNPNEYWQGVEFEHIPYVNYVDFRTASGEIIEVGCSSGLRASGTGTFGDSFLNSLKCNSVVTLILVLTLLGITVGVIFIIWRKRK